MPARSSNQSPACFLQNAPYETVSSQIEMEISFSSLAASQSGRLGKPHNHFDFKIEACQPVHADRGPIRVRLRPDFLQPDRIDRLELCGRIGVETGHVDHIVKRAARRLQHGIEIVEGKLNLLFEIRFGRP